MKRWAFALTQALIMTLVIFVVLGIVDAIAPTTQQASSIEWHWTIVGGVLCWGVLGALFHRLDNPEEL